MRLALVGLTHPFRGGIAHYTTLLCEALRRRHDVRFYALSRQYPELLFPGKTQIDHSDSGLAVQHEASIDSIAPWTWVTTARRIREFAPELVIFSWWHPFFAPSFGTIAHLSRIMGRVPSCFLCHNAIPHERSRIDLWLLRYAFSSAAAFIAHSRQDVDDLRRLRPGVPVSYNPHPTYEVFTPERVPRTADAKAALGLADRRVVLFFGFVRAYKGLDVLLEAIERLPADAGYHLLLVGEFYEDPAKYRAALDRLTAENRLTLVDRYVSNEELPSLFCAADVVAVPYLSATQSGVVQMAYAFGKPVVATRVGGIPETVVEGRTGYLVPPRDAQALAGALARYFDEADPEEFRQSILQESDRYSWERMVETIESVAAEVAG